DVRTDPTRRTRSASRLPRTGRTWHRRVPAGLGVQLQGRIAEPWTGAERPVAAHRTCGHHLDPGHWGTTRRRCNARRRATFGNRIPARKLAHLRLPRGRAARRVGIERAIAHSLAAWPADAPCARRRVPRLDVAPDAAVSRRSTARCAPCARIRVA